MIASTENVTRNAHFLELPASFDAASVLPMSLWTHADSARWLVSQIVRKLASRDVDPFGAVHLDSRILYRVMAHDVARRIIESLKAAEVITTTAYSVGQHSCGYVLASRFLKDRCVHRPVVDVRLAKRLDAEADRWESDNATSHWKPIHAVLAEEQLRLSIEPEADRVLSSMPDNSRLCQTALVGRLRRRDFRFTVSALTGRVFGNFSGLSRQIRPYVRIDGEPIAGVDIVASQPSLLAMMMARGFPSNGVKKPETYRDAPAGDPPRVAAAECCDGFADAVLGGRLYEVLMSETGMSRDDVKLSLLRDVLAKRGNYPSAVESAFASLYPQAHAYVRWVNRFDHGELIRALQRAESRLVIEQVAPRLVGRAPIVTLHDAIWSTHRSLGAVEAAFAEVFEAIEFRLSLKREAG